MDFLENIKKGNFAVICEIDPPKGVDTSGLFSITDQLKGRVDAFLLTDMSSAVMRMGSLTASYMLMKKGFNTIYNLSCRDRNILAMQSDVLSAAALGIRNILITNGDDITLGDHPGAAPVNEINADKMISIVKMLNEGKDASGNPLESSPSFNVGAVVNSNCDDSGIDDEMKRVESRIKQGVSYLITPAVFDLKVFGKFMKRIRQFNIPVIASTILLKSVATARFLNRHIEGVSVPDVTIERLYSAGDKLKESISITADLIKGFQDTCNGVNLIAIGWESKLPAFLDAVGD